MDDNCRFQRTFVAWLRLQNLMDAQFHKIRNFDQLRKGKCQQKFPTKLSLFYLFSYFSFSIIPLKEFL